MYRLFNPSYNFEESLQQFYAFFNDMISDGSMSEYQSKIVHVEKNFLLFSHFVKNMLANNSVDENIKLIYRLTYYPNLIGVALNVLVEQKETIAPQTSSNQHPILNQLMHQSTDLYGRRSVNDNKYNSTRLKLETFLKALKQDAPEYFTHRDTYGYTSLERLVRLDPGSVDITSIKTLNLLQLMKMDNHELNLDWRTSSSNRL